ncbi:MAG: glycerol-3-phosphate dehydrogenase/oxidase [Actinobacteria bacterium]|nr:glycerol-3-phosphate dehydrogenase/oxidase [Actinomycetota bacterium]
MRYLEMFDFHLVFEACRERRRLLKNAPHLVYPQAFTFPVYKGDDNGVLMIWAGLWTYDTLALFRNVHNHRMHLGDNAQEIEKNIEHNGLKAAGVFYDCSTDDARLTLAFVLSAANAGATCVNYLEATELLSDGKRLSGVRATDNITDEEFDIEGKIVINAAGPWADLVCKLSEPDIPDKLVLTKGSHIVVPRGRARTENAVPIVSPSDKRLMFVIPRGRFSLIGTTDTYYSGDIDDPYATRKDVEYILEAANHALPKSHLDMGDIISTYSGLRPLAMKEGGGDVKESSISREHRIYHGFSGLLTIAGGKLTTARSMAEEMVDVAERDLEREYGIKGKGPCVTSNRPILGTPLTESVDRTKTLSKKMRFDDETLCTLLKQGTDALEVLSLCDRDGSMAEKLSPEIPYIKAQVEFATRNEMALTVTDFMVRRSEIFYTATDQGISVSDSVADIMGDALNWSSEEKTLQAEKYRDIVKRSRRYL